MNAISLFSYLDKTLTEFFDPAATIITHCAQNISLKTTFKFASFIETPILLKKRFSVIE